MASGIDRYLPYGGKKVWTEDEHFKLEDQLGEIVDRFFATAADVKRWDAEREEAARRQREALAQAQETQRQDEARQKEAERRILLEEENRNRLIAMARNWREARVIRRFIRVCASVLDRECQPVGWRENWLTWAKAHADRIDPMTNGYLEAEHQRLTSKT
jgi:hypothetical protein